MNRTASRNVGAVPVCSSPFEQGLDPVATEIALAGDEGGVGLACKRFGRVVDLDAFAGGETEESEMPRADPRAQKCQAAGCELPMARGRIRAHSFVQESGQSRL